MDQKKDLDKLIQNEAKVKNCGCGKDPCETYGKVEETAGKALEAAIQELKALAGLNS